MLRATRAGSGSAGGRDRGTPERSHERVGFLCLFVPQRALLSLIQPLVHEMKLVLDVGGAASDASDFPRCRQEDEHRKQRKRRPHPIEAVRIHPELLTNETVAVLLLHQVLRHLLVEVSLRPGEGATLGFWCCVSVRLDDRCGQGRLDAG